MTTISDLASALIAAHDGGAPVGTVPESVTPADLDAVYAMQDEIIRQIGSVGGWKVAAGLGDPPLCSPVPANRIFADGEVVDGKQHRIFLAEIEVAVVLGADIKGGASAAEVEAAIASVHPAIELIANPFVDRDATPRNLQLADLQSNGAIILGKAVDRAVTGALDTVKVTLELDGKPVHSVETGASWDVIVKDIAWLAGHAEERGLALKAGQVIITGARALLKLDGATKIVGRMGEWGAVNCGV